MKKNILIKITIFVVVILIFVFLSVKSAFAQSCPANTEVGETQATLVGEVTDDGGDPNLTVWFEYGKTIPYSYKTPKMSKYGTGLFCATIYNLEPCTTYNYRAVAQNSAGISYGENKTFTTKCAPVKVDLKANGSDGPVTLYYGDNVNLSWKTENANYCEASGDWSGNKAVSGYETIKLTTLKTYTFILTCRNATGSQTASDSVQVTLKAKPPVVITKPAVVTY